MTQGDGSKLYVAGGIYHGGTMSDTFQIFSVSTSSWSTGSSMVRCLCSVNACAPGATCRVSGGNGSASVEGAHIDTSPGLVHSTQPSCPHRRVSSVDVRTTPSHLLPLFAFAAFAFVSGPAGTPLDH